MTRDSLVMLSAPFVLVFGLGASGCGGGPVEEAVVPPSLPLVDSTTSTTSAAATTSEASIPPLAISMEMLEGMLATEQGRALLVSGIGSEIGLSPREAECLIDGVPVEALVAAANAFLDGGASDGPFSEEQLTEIAPVLDACEIPVESLSGDVGR